MSVSPTSPDHGIGALVGEGYHLALLDGVMTVAEIPYVTPGRTVRRGTLVVPLRHERGIVAAPGGHLVRWAGEPPCDAGGSMLPIVHPGRVAGADVADARHQLCAKPPGREFRDYHELVNAYVALLGSHAALLEPAATARSRRVLPAAGPRSVTAYADTASIRSGTSGLTRRIAAETVGIIGVGGTGGWVLDLVSKTPAAAIHLFDDDVFEQHTAFRAPGAAPAAVISRAPAKVEHMAQVYGAMHRRIIPHRIRIDERTMPMLDPLTFVFVCVDTAAARAPIAGGLIERGIPFVDVGMGLHIGDRGVGGIVRTALVPAGDAAAIDGRVPLEGEAEDPYSTNIQTAELNALNASLAVVEWKRLRGFYAGGGGATGSLLVIEPSALHRLDGRATGPGADGAAAAPEVVRGGGAA